MGLIRKLYRPTVFQGKLDSSGYFEGWYFKQVSADLSHVYAFIPGIALEVERCAFIQVINGITGATYFVRYPLSAFSGKENSFDVRIGGSRFTDSFIELDIDSPEVRVNGRLEFSGTSPYPARILSPGIMGWYSFVPRMECKHGLVSMDHAVDGRLEIREGRRGEGAGGEPGGISEPGSIRTVDFGGGRGYIEKDWGTSFPESWIWMQTNNFSRPGSSFMLSIAKIPWMGRHFIGLISFLKIGTESSGESGSGVPGKNIPRRNRPGDNTRFFATYNGAKIVRIERIEGGPEDNCDERRGDPSGEEQARQGVRLTVSRGKDLLQVEARSTRRGALKSPVQGRMDSYIKESVDAEIEIEYRDETGTIFRDTGLRGGLEITEGIFGYF